MSMSKQLVLKNVEIGQLSEAFSSFPLKNH